MPSSTLMAAISVSIWARNSSASAALAIARRDASEQRLGLGLREIGGSRGRMAVIGRGRAVLPEERAALAMRLEIAAPGRGVAAGQLAEPREIFAKPLEFRIDDRVGPIGGDDPARSSPIARMVSWCFRGSSGLSVVAIASMPKRSKSARGRNSGVRKAASIRS